ncbi:MFS transporter [Nonomuraea sp. NPDC049480]|uniref:MFS transporter n=1 Tax=Nonomuraea sp. NPDC049480 TaxID=3364353 RepID=UPI00378735BD
MTFARLPALPRLLIATQFAFNIGFFAVLPYLSAHLTGSLALAGWLAGLILGLRTFSQQGLFVIGGALTDRFGPRPVVLAGCALRVAGFAWLGFAESTWAVVAAVLLIGFAAALFSPAVESEIVRQAAAHERATGVARAQVLGLFNAAGQAGALIGPVLGTALLGLGFRAACLAGAAVFVLVLLGQLALMPSGSTAARRDGARGVVDIARNRRFLGLCGAYGSYLLLYNQLYLALPAQVERATGTQGALGWLFALSSALVVAGQLPLSGWAARRLSLRRSLLIGLGLMAAGAVAAGLLLPVRAAGGLLPSLAFVVLLTAGQMLVVPAARAWLPDLAEDHRLGLYTGAMFSLSGLLVLAGGAPLGALFDAEGPLPWFALAAVALAGALCVPKPPRGAGGPTRAAP